MKQYKVEVKYTFKGHFIVNAENKSEAHNNVEELCGFTSGAGPHTTLSNEDVPDYEFPVHPESVITDIRLNK